MNDHESINTLLPEYAAGGQDADIRRSIEDHLKICEDCRQDLALWQMVSAGIADANREIRPNPGLVKNAIRQVQLQERKTGKLRQGWLLLRSQIPLVRREIWPASIAIMIIGYIAAILVGKEAIIQALAPLVASASIAMIFGSENNPAMELMMTTPTSPRQLFLARLAIVFSFNFIISCIVSVCLLPVIPGLDLWPMIMGWLAPMSFLSAMAMFLSIYIGSENAIIATYGAWVLKFLFIGAASTDLFLPNSTIHVLVDHYIRIWQEPGLLLTGAVALVLAAVLVVGRMEFHGTHLAG